MKAVLSNRIYLEVGPILREQLREELTYKIETNKPGTYEFIKNYKQISDKIISIPIGRDDLIPDDYEIIDKRVLVPETFPNFRYTLRDSQQLIHDAVYDNCLINAKVSWGKTFTALKIAEKLGQKTLVVTHNLGLRSQWVEETEKVFGFTPGIIGSGKKQLNSPIVIGNTQTLYKVIGEIGKDFGTIIVDECHRVPSRTFSHVVDYCYARYRIGLSGTLERKDGRHIVLRDFFGSIVHKPPTENSMEPRVDVIMSNIRLPATGAIPWATRMNMLVSHEDYQQLIVLLSAIYAKNGHKVLVLSDRVEFLKFCKDQIGESALLITGKTDLETRASLKDLIKTHNIIFGTQSIFSEGISINALSCLILATPVNNEPLLTQLIGRIVREHPNKLQPVIVDVQLKGGTALKQGRARLAHYRLEGYETRFITL